MLFLPTVTINGLNLIFVKVEFCRELGFKLGKLQDAVENNSSLVLLSTVCDLKLDFDPADYLNTIDETQ